MRHRAAHDKLGVKMRDSYDSGHWKSVDEKQREREQQARDRQAQNAAAYLADVSSDH